MSSNISLYIIRLAADLDVFWRVSCFWWSECDFSEVFDDAVLLGGARVGVRRLTVADRLLDHAAHPVVELLPVEGRAHEADGDVLADGEAEGVERAVEEALVRPQVGRRGLRDSSAELGDGSALGMGYCWRRSIRKNSDVFIFRK